MTEQLSTASVKIQDENVNSITVRVLLDSASQSNFIADSYVKYLGLPREKSEVIVQALVGAQIQVVRGRKKAVVHPVDN